MNHCPSCHNEFVQPFVCTTCGAARLHDAELASAHARLAELERQRDVYREIARDAYAAIYSLDMDYVDRHLTAEYVRRASPSRSEGR